MNNNEHLSSLKVREEAFVRVQMLALKESFEPFLIFCNPIALLLMASQRQANNLMGGCTVVMATLIVILSRQRVLLMNKFLLNAMDCGRVVYAQKKELTSLEKKMVRLQDRLRDSEQIQELQGVVLRPQILSSSNISSQ